MAGRPAVLCHGGECYTQFRLRAACYPEIITPKKGPLLQKTLTYPSDEHEFGISAIKNHKCDVCCKIFGTLVR